MECYADVIDFKEVETPLTRFVFADEGLRPPQFFSEIHLPKSQVVAERSKYGGQEAVKVGLGCIRHSDTGYECLTHIPKQNMLIA